MKPLFISALAVAALLVPHNIARTADSTAVSTELKGVVDAVRMKIVSGRKTEAALGDELRRFDKLLADHGGEKTDEVAQILLMKAMIYIQVLDQPDKGVAMVERLKTDFPNTTQGRSADQILQHIRQQLEAKKARNALGEGVTFPDFQERDLEGKPLSIADYKGKVVLIDFWATWCRPCWRELPWLLKVYEAHHKDGFEIIGISLDEDKQALENFLKDRKMSWPQYFDGRRWGNKIVARFGVDSIPANFLLDREGKVIGKDLRGPALEETVTEALTSR